MKQAQRTQRSQFYRVAKDACLVCCGHSVSEGDPVLNVAVFV